MAIVSILTVEQLVKKMQIPGLRPGLTRNEEVLIIDDLEKNYQGFDYINGSSSNPSFRLFKLPDGGGIIVREAWLEEHRILRYCLSTEALDVEWAQLKAQNRHR